MLTAVDSTVVDAFYAGNSVVIGQNFHRRAARLPTGLDADRFEMRDVDFVDPQNGWLLVTHNVGGCGRPGCVNITALLGTKDGGNKVNLLLQNSHTRPEAPRN